MTTEHNLPTAEQLTYFIYGMVAVMKKLRLNEEQVNILGSLLETNLIEEFDTPEFRIMIAQCNDINEKKLVNIKAILKGDYHEPA